MLVHIVAILRLMLRRLSTLKISIPVPMKYFIFFLSNKNEQRSKYLINTNILNFIGRHLCTLCDRCILKREKMLLYIVLINIIYPIYMCTVHKYNRYKNITRAVLRTWWNWLRPRVRQKTGRKNRYSVIPIHMYCLFIISF